jgi:hypothetical protein
MDRALEWLIKLLFLVILAPFLVGIALHLFTALAVALLPWLIVVGVIVGVAAGISFGLVLRRRLPPRNGGAPVPPTARLGPYRIRRPRGPAGRR